MKLPIAAATLALTAGLAAPAASGADFWLQGRYSGPIVKRNCDTHGGQFYMHGGLRYGCELADDPKLPFARLFDDLVGAGEDRGRDRETERLGGF